MTDPRLQCGMAHTLDRFLSQRNWFGASVVGLLLAATPGLAGPAAIQTQTLDLQLDPAQGTLRASARWDVAPGGITSLTISLPTRYDLGEVAVDGRVVKPRETKTQREGEAAPAPRREFQVALPKRASEKPTAVTLRWSGKPPSLPANYTFNRNEVTELPEGYLSPDGAFLPGGAWYPTLEGAGLSRFSVTAQLPAGWRMVAAGRLSRADDGTETYRSEAPLEGLDLVAAPFSVMEDQVLDQRIAVYTLPGTPRELANTYLLAAGEYVKRFTAEIGPHAWPQFVVVEHLLPTGYGMPSWTLLGGAVMRLPFIVKTSLGHEVLHDWWGNGVYVDRSQGNWCEGLTAYLADHAFSAEEKGDGGRDYRVQILREFTEYTAHGSDLPLSQFTERHDFRTRAIGYGKVAMVFHMLRLHLGPERFTQAIRQFYAEQRFARASWGTIRELFSRVAGEDLGWFFQQWVEQPGAPRLTVGTPRVTASDDQTVVRLPVTATPGWRLDLPMRARPAGADRTRWLDGFGTLGADGVGEVRAAAPGRLEPVEVELDPDSDLMRLLQREEIPVTLARYLAAPPELIVLGTGRPELIESARRIADEVGAGKALVRRDSELTREELGRAARVLWIGRPVETAAGALLKLPDGVVMEADRLAFSGGNITEPDAAMVMVLDNPAPGTGALVLLDALRPAQIEPLLGKITHYGKYSYLLFGGGKAVIKGVWDPPIRPLTVDLH